MYQALSLQSGLELYGPEIAEQYEGWLNAFEELGKSMGIKKKKARKLAMEGLIKVQGALLVSRVFNDTSVFQEVIAELQQQYG